MKKNNILFALVLLSTPLFSQLASWNLSGLTGTTAGLVSTSNVAPGVSSAILSRGSGIVAQSAEGAYGSSGWATSSTPGSTDYYSINIALAPTSLPVSSFGTLMIYVTTTGPGPVTASLRSSQNGYSTDIGGPVSMDAGSGGFSDYLIFDLSTLASVPAGGSLTLRLYGYDANNTNSNARFDIGDGPLGANTDIIFNAVLPVTLLDFSAVAHNNTVGIQWSTTDEKDNDYFTVERSGDGVSFDGIGEKNGAGTSTGVQRYSFTDETPLAGKNYYRLRQTDFDGKSTYSNIVVTAVGQTPVVYLSPSPASDLMRIQLDQPATNDGVWQVYDAAGRMVQSGNWAAETDVHTIQVQTLTDGMYVFRLLAGNTSLVKQFRKQ